MFNDLTYCRHRETSHRHFTEGGVVIMRGDAVLRGVAKDLRDVLVAVVRIEEVEAPVLGVHGQGPRGDGFCRVPHELRPHGVTLRRGHRHNAKRQIPCIDRHLRFPSRLRGSFIPSRAIPSSDKRWA